LSLGEVNESLSIRVSLNLSRIIGLAKRISIDSVEKADFTAGGDS
jgi:hypothetical protein